MAARRGSPHASDAGPVVVTLGVSGEVLDVVGDLDRFVGPGEDQGHTIQRLADLLVGESPPPEMVHTVELAPERFADIHIVVEEDSRHFVLMDVSKLMGAMRRRQQTGNEIALEAETRRRGLSNALGGATGPVGELKRLASTDPLGVSISRMQAEISQLIGHARLLEAHCVHDPVLLRSVAAIQAAAVRLGASCADSLVVAGVEFNADQGGSADTVDTHALAVFLQERFTLQARVQGVVFEVRVAEAPVSLAIDDVQLRHLLLNLIIHALTPIYTGSLIVSLSANDRALEIEIGREPAGFESDHFAGLVTGARASAALEVDICRVLLKQFEARFGLVELPTGGMELWLHLPLRRSVAGLDGTSA